MFAPFLLYTASSLRKMYENARFQKLEQTIQCLWKSIEIIVFLDKWHQIVPSNCRITWRKINKFSTGIKSKRLGGRNEWDRSDRQRLCRTERRVIDLLGNSSYELVDTGVVASPSCCCLLSTTPTHTHTQRERERHTHTRIHTDNSHFSIYVFLSKLPVLLPAR